MGGSGGSSQRSGGSSGGSGGAQGTSGTSGSSSGNVGAGSACPEVRTAILIDVASAGNASLALSLPLGSALDLVADNDLYRVDASGQPLGWIPEELSRILRRCIDQGYVYTAVLRSVTTGNPPRIEVTVLRP